MRYRIAFILVGLIAAVPRAADAQADFLLLRFEQYLESLVEQAGIPGMSAAIVQNGRILWERGFGQQDVERNLAATPDTPYHVGGLTETFTATMILQCVEAGELSLDDRMALYTTAIPEPAAKVRHVLTHTSEGTPGADFKYDPARYAALGAVIESCGATDFRTRLARAVLDRLAMIDSVPGQDLEDQPPLPEGAFDETTTARYLATLQRLARPYRVDKNGKAVPSAYPSKQIDGSTGLISTVRDLARYDTALDEELLLERTSLETAWTGPVAPDGRTLPHGLGWFVQTYNGRRVVWQYGQCPDSCSSLIVKLPDSQLTLILLANSDGLSAPFKLSAGDVTVSLFARLFLRLFA